MISQVNTASTLLVTIFGFLLNFLTIWMVLRHTQQEMRIYSRILLQTCVTDLLAICTNAFVQPVFFSDGGVGTVWSYGPVQWLPHPWHCICFLLYVFMMRFSTISISSVFIYRYLVVKRNVTMTMRRYAYLLASVTFPVAILVSSSFMSNCPSPANEQLTNPVIVHILGLDNQNHTSGRNIVSIRANGAKGGASFTSVLAMSISICSYLIVIFCGISIHLHIRRRYSGPTMVVKRKVDGQITVVLAVQAILPMLTLIPNLMANMLIRFKLSMGLLLIYIGMFTSVPATWILVLNPLATLLCVRTYRLALVKMIYAAANCRKAIPAIRLTCEPKPKNTSSEEILGEEESEGSETLL